MWRSEPLERHIGADCFWVRSNSREYHFIRVRTIALWSAMMSLQNVLLLLCPLRIDRGERRFRVAYGRAPEMPSMMTFRQLPHVSGLNPSTTWGITSRMTSSITCIDKGSVITLSNGYQHESQEECKRLVLPTMCIQRKHFFSWVVLKWCNCFTFHTS